MHPEKDKLENAMFFVKALPLSPVMDVSNFIFDRLMIFNFYKDRKFESSFIVSFQSI